MKELPIYEKSWRNKWLTCEAKSVNDMITSLEAAIAQLKELQAVKEITWNFKSADDDYIFYYTQNKEVARKYGMRRYDEDEECFYPVGEE